MSKTLRVSCDRCQTMVINGHPTHEIGCDFNDFKYMDEDSEGNYLQLKGCFTNSKLERNEFHPPTGDSVWN